MRPNRCQFLSQITLGIGKVLRVFRALALGLIHSETHCFTFGNQFIMSYATGLATDNMARARPWWRQQHLALAARLKAGILALGHGAQQGCRCNALAIEHV